MASPPTRTGARAAGDGQDPTPATTDVRALSRGIEVLKAVAADRTARGLALMEIAHATSLHKSTAHRLVGVLVREELLIRDEENERYRLGVAALELGGAYLDRLTPRREAMPFLEKLMVQTNETVHLGVLEGHEVLYVEKIEAPANVIVHTRIGHREQVHCTALGKAMLAYLPERDLEAIVARGLPARTRNTITDPVKLRAVLAQVRKRGYAVSLEESRELVHAVAATILDHRAYPVAAVVISGLKQRLPSERLQELGVLLKEAAIAISSRMGYSAHRPRHA
jgi:IclR family acetate operon transcriptional repressor